jgi:hypothetical protein
MVLAHAEAIKADTFGEDGLLDDVSQDARLWQRLPRGIEGNVAEGVQAEFERRRAAHLFNLPGASAEVENFPRRMRYPPLHRPLSMQPGAAIGPYVVERHLGDGGMGSVWLAEDTRLHRRVALKTLRTARATDDTGRQQLMREARAAAALNHRHIATVYDVIEVDGDIAIVFEHVEGTTLATLLAGGPCRSIACFRSPCSWPRRWPPRISTVSCIATSSPRTSSSTPTVT